MIIHKIYLSNKFNVGENYFELRRTKKGFYRTLKHIHNQIEVEFFDTLDEALAFHHEQINLEIAKQLISIKEVK